MIRHVRDVDGGDVESVDPDSIPLTSTELWGSRFAFGRCSGSPRDG